MRCDRQAFVRMYDVISQDLYRYSLCMMKNTEDAKDAVSDAVVSAYENIHKLRKPEAFKSDDRNAVYVMDDKLNIIGSIENLAKDERVYSARFMGGTGYFVTYRETDPLFSVDLSDPEAPKIMGELKIPGFSEYLHIYGEDMLLGIGMDVDKETQTSRGIKLTMFDISDKTDVKEAHTYTFEHVFDAEVLREYKAALIAPPANLIGFSAYRQGQEIYYIFNYDENSGFTCRMEEEVNGSGRSARGVYIEDTLYVSKGNVIEAHSLKDYQKTDDIIL